MMMVSAGSSAAMSSRSRGLECTSLMPPPPGMSAPLPFCPVRRGSATSGGTADRRGRSPAGKDGPPPPHTPSCSTWRTTSVMASCPMFGQPRPVCGASRIRPRSFLSGGSHHFRWTAKEGCPVRQEEPAARQRNHLTVGECQPVKRRNVPGRWRRWRDVPPPRSRWSTRSPDEGRSL